MKEIILTDRSTINQINEEIKWINSEIESFTKYLKYQKLNDDINANVDIYSENIIRSCNLIKNRIEIEN